MAESDSIRDTSLHVPPWARRVVGLSAGGSVSASACASAFHSPIKP